MNPTAQQSLDKAGEVATALISDTAGAVADPKTAFKMAKKRSRKMAPLVALFALAVVLVALKLRRSGD